MVPEEFHAKNGLRHNQQCSLSSQRSTHRMICTPLAIRADSAPGKAALAIRP
jgi:hypothetical protein